MWRLKRVVVHLLHTSASHLKHNDNAAAHRLFDLFIHPRHDEELRNDVAVLVVSSILSTIPVLVFYAVNVCPIIHTTSLASKIFKCSTWSH